MAKGVNKSDYQASASEKASAQVATSRYADWKNKYSPLLQKQAVDSQTDAVKTTLRGRANADTMQKLSPALGSYDGAQSTTMAGDAAKAVTGQLGAADKSALKYKNAIGIDTLAKSQQIAGTAAEGIAQAARIGVSSQLARAQANQEVATSKWNAVAKIGSAFAGQAIENYGQKTKDIFTPGIASGVNPDTGQAIYRAAKGIGERWDAGTKRNF